MIVLASESPRRRALLAEAGIAFRVMPASIDEWEPARASPTDVARQNAEAKAKAVAATLTTDEWVLGADTVVALGDLILGKPRDAAHAQKILGTLSGTTHGVYTGVAFCRGDRIESDVVTTHVTMRTLTPDEIAAYVASGEAFGKAGAYAIQETADRFVTQLDGPYDNVVGLPVETVRQLLHRLEET